MAAERLFPSNGFPLSEGAVASTVDVLSLVDCEEGDDDGCGFWGVA